MVGESVFPKADGDIFYASEANTFFNQELLKTLVRGSGPGLTSLTIASGATTTLATNQVHKYKEVIVGNYGTLAITGSGLPAHIRVETNFVVSGLIDLRGQGFSGGAASVNGLRYDWQSYPYNATGGYHGGVNDGTPPAGGNAWPKSVYENAKFNPFAIVYPGTGGGGGGGGASTGNKGGGGGASVIGNGDSGLGTLFGNSPNGALGGAGGAGGGAAMFITLGSFILGAGGSILANGLNGAAATAGGGSDTAGGGGGGGGGTIVILSPCIIKNGVINASGGQGGAGRSAATNGGIGGSGFLVLHEFLLT